jgi:hypothetical protein
MLLILAAICLATAVYVVANLATAPARERASLVRRAANYGHLRNVVAGPERLRFRERVLGPSAVWLARLMLRVNPRQSLDELGRKLMAAGMRNTTPQALLAAKGFCAAGGLVGGLLFGSAVSASAALTRWRPAYAPRWRAAAPGGRWTRGGPRSGRRRCGRGAPRGRRG